MGKPMMNAPTGRPIKAIAITLRMSIPIPTYTDHTRLVPAKTFAIRLPALLDPSLCHEAAFFLTTESFAPLIASSSFLAAAPASFLSTLSSAALTANA